MEPTMQNDNDNDDMLPQSAADTTTLAAITGAEIDRQIATAHAFPRSIKKFQHTVMEMACLNDRVAGECIYALPRKENGQTKMIEGPSARFAEIVASAWGNCRAGARIIAEEADFIVAQGAFHDLERNVAISFEVRRSIRGKFGRYKPDMISMTGNAAASIALRNAVFKGVPKAYWAPAWEEARKVTLGNSATLETRRLACMQDLAKMGAKEANVFALLNVKGLQDVTLEHMVMLRGIVTAIREGDSTVEQSFPDPITEASVAKQGAAATTVSQTGTQQPDKRTRKSEKAKEKAAEPEQWPGDRKVTDLDAREGTKAFSAPITATTEVFMPWDPHKAEGAVGSLLYQGAELPIMQLGPDGMVAMSQEQEEEAYEHVADYLAKRVTQHSKRARMDRQQAMAWAGEVLKTKPPESFTKLTVTQLVDLVRSIDDPKD